MLSQNLNQSKKPGIIEQTASIFYETGSELLTEQAEIAKYYYNRRSGDLLSMLSGRNFSVMSSSRGVKLVIDYLKYIRFLDLKKTAKGKKKKIYQPIYNRPVYGYIYNVTYPKLQNGLSSNVRERTVEPLKAVLSDPIEISS